MWEEHLAHRAGTPKDKRSLVVDPQTLQRETEPHLQHSSIWGKDWWMLEGAVALEGEKVSPKVDFFSPDLMDDGTNMGSRDEVLHLSLAFQMERILSFSSIRSASVALKIIQQVKM